MLIAAESINASRQTVREIIEAQDAEPIVQLARDQKEKGAHFIGANAGVFGGKEAELL